MSKPTAPKSVRPANPWVEAFRVGTHTAMNGSSLTFSDADVSLIADQVRAQIAGGYQPPIVTGHPALNSPRLGSIVDAKVEGDKLLLKADDLDPEFAEACQKGQYKYVSISIYPDKRLRHLGVLGAAPPAVKGLAPIAFGEGMFAEIDQGHTPETVLEFAASADSLESLVGSFLSRIVWRLRDLGGLFRSQREVMIEKDGREAADKVFPEYVIKDLESLKLPDPLPQFGEAAPPSTPSSPAAGATATFSEPPARVAQLEEENRKLREQLQLRETEKAFAEFGERLDALTDQGRLLPVLRPHVEALYKELHGLGHSFAEGDAIGAALDGILSNLPKQVEFGEMPAGSPPTIKNPLVADAESRASKEK